MDIIATEPGTVRLETDALDQVISEMIASVDRMIEANRQAIRALKGIPDGGEDGQQKGAS